MATLPFANLLGAPEETFPAYMGASLFPPTVQDAGFLPSCACLPYLSPCCLNSVPLVLVEDLKTLHLRNPLAVVTIPGPK